MSDYKSPYSEASSLFIDDANASQTALAISRSSKRREEKHNDEWLKNKVSLNDVCDRFAPGDRGHEEKGKYIFEGDRYNVVADMSAGYLRIWDKTLCSYVTLDGLPDRHNRHSHYKILRREEM